MVARGSSVREVAQGKVQSGEAVGPALSDDESSSLTYPCEEAGRGTTEPLSRALRPHASIVVVAGSQSAFGSEHKSPVARFGLRTRRPYEA